MPPVRTILHPTDFSEASHLAFRLACALARAWGARLVLLHVAAPDGLVFGDASAVPEAAGVREELTRRLAGWPSGRARRGPWPWKPGS